MVWGRFVVVEELLPGPKPELLLEKIETTGFSHTAIRDGPGRGSSCLCSVNRLQI